MSLRLILRPLGRAAVARSHTFLRCSLGSTRLPNGANRLFSTRTPLESWWRGQDSNGQSIQDHSAPELKSPEIPEHEAQEGLVSRRVHILGLGSIGTFIAHALKCLPNPPPITLLLHRPEMYEEFKSKARIVRLINPKTGINDEQSGYDVDLLEKNIESGHPYWKFYPDFPRNPNDGIYSYTSPTVEGEVLDSGEIYINNLIVTVKGPVTKQALQSVKHRLNAQSTVCLIQNGMGQVEELLQEVFTDPLTRPTFMLGVISHGVYLERSFNAIHAGFGTTAVGILRDTDKFPLSPKSFPQDLSDSDRRLMYPSDKELYSPISSRYLLRTLTRSPILSCASFPYLDLFQLQLEKLAINALINPLTALLDVPNGRLLYNSPLQNVERLLLAEISLVIRQLPELAGVPNARARFSPDRLETLFLGVLRKTRENNSSMRQDVRRMTETEVAYINGYIVKRGEELGIKCVLNYMIMQLVRGKSWMQKSDRLAGAVVAPYVVRTMEDSMEVKGR